MNIDAASKTVIGLIGQLNALPSSKLEGEALRERITKISTEANRALSQVRAHTIQDQETLRALAKTFNSADKRVMELVQARLSVEPFILHGVREFV